MTNPQPPAWITALYPVGRLRGYRITRSPEQEMGQFCLDAHTAWELGTENIGVLVGNCHELKRTLSRLRPLDAASEPTVWIVISATRDMAVLVYKLWHFPDDDRRVRLKDVPQYWCANRLHFTTPEGLQDPKPFENLKTCIGGLLLLDLQFHVHKARRFTKKDFQVNHDRPQFITDFRACCVRENWSPPLIIFAGPPAKSLTTDAIKCPYCLETLWFVDGETFICCDGQES